MCEVDVTRVGPLFQLADTQGLSCLGFKLFVCKTKDFTFLLLMSQMVTEFQTADYLTINNAS